MSDAGDGEMTKLRRGTGWGGDRHGTDHHNRVGWAAEGRRAVHSGGKQECGLSQLGLAG